MDFPHADLEACRRLLGDALAADADDWEVHDLVIDLLDSEGDQVCALEWDSGSPGAGAGSEAAYEWRGKFFFLGSDGLGGPFAALADAMQGVIPMTDDGRIIVGAATREISCWRWSIAELIDHLELDTHDPHAVLVLNGERWYLETLEQEQSKRRGSQ